MPTFKVRVYGYPRSGTRYMANLFRSCGWDVGHEVVGKNGVSSWRSDSLYSSLEKPYISLLVVRNPKDAVSSLLLTGSWNSLLDLFSLYSPPDHRLVDKLLRCWCTCNRTWVKRGARIVFLPEAASVVREVTGNSPYCHVGRNARSGPRGLPLESLVSLDLWHETLSVWRFLHHKTKEGVHESDAGVDSI